MKIGVYLEHGEGDGVGGAELMMAFLASAWSRQHEVDLVHHRPPLTRERLALFSTEDYSRVTSRAVTREPEPPASRNVLQRYRAARDWHAGLSEPYDLFVNCTHWVPCFSRARRSVLLVLFPFYVPPWRHAELERVPQWKRLQHRAYYELEWRRRLGTYDAVLAISRYSAGWTRRRWGVEPEVVYPPVDVDFQPGTKDDLIVSVGRFSTTAHTKKQLEMVRAFASMQADLCGWRYACVGGLNSRVQNHEYFDRVRAEGSRSPVLVEANAPPARVRDLLSRARIFWHATGLGEDADARPELAEHFGIATVEAMAAGCVPVVIARGGQPEIVTHGVNGFLWNTLDELKHYTRQLAADRQLWSRLSDAAQRRARDFARSRFIERMSTVCEVDAPVSEPQPRSVVAAY